MLITAVITLLCLVSTFGNAIIFKGYTVDNITFFLFLVSAVGNIVMSIRFNSWMSKRNIKEMSLIHFYKTGKFNAEQVHEMVVAVDKHENKVKNWYDNLSHEDKEMADWHAKKHFNDIVDKL